MHKFLKTIHLFGLGAGFGGLLCKLWTEAPVGPLIIGGLGLSAASGLMMMQRLKLSPSRQRWLLVHMSAATAATLAGAAIATPVGSSLPSSLLQPLAILGVGLLTLTIACGVFKPRSV